jgi:Uma2 family endonuclease
MRSSGVGKTAQRLTCDEFSQGVDPGLSCELVRGEVIELSPGGLDHARPSANVVIALGNWARAGKRGRIFTNEVGLITERDPDTLRGADVVYYSYERLPRGDQRGFSEVPLELVVEVCGRGQSWPELHAKAAEYLRMGVDRVWLIDSAKRTVHVLSRDAAPIQYGPTDVLRDPAILPGFEITVGELFED